MLLAMRWKRSQKLGSEEEWSFNASLCRGVQLVELSYWQFWFSAVYSPLQILITCIGRWYGRKILNQLLEALPMLQRFYKPLHLIWHAVPCSLLPFLFQFLLSESVDSWRNNSLLQCVPSTRRSIHPSSELKKCSFLFFRISGHRWTREFSSSLSISAPRAWDNRSASFLACSENESNGGNSI